MRIWGTSRSVFRGRVRSRSFQAEFDSSGAGWWIGGVLLYLVTSAMITAALLLTEFATPVAVIGGLLGAAVLMAYWLVNGRRREPTVEDDEVGPAD